MSESVDLAGRDLDAEVARRIFGWKSWANSSPNSPFFLSPETRALPHMAEYELVETDSGNEENAPHYSSSIAAAMEVVEKMRAEGFTVLMRSNKKDEWLVEFWKKGKCKCGGWSPTLPEAICRSALAARSGQ